MSTEVKIGVLQKLLVTEVTGKGRTLFVQLDTPEAYQVQDLSREIESHILEQNRNKVNFTPGSKCYARASDGVMYRALIVKHNPNKNSATVYFIDYGNSEDVDVSKVFPPSGKFFTLPMQALCCTLGDFIPNNSQWTEEISSILVDRLVNQEVFGVFRSQSSNLHPYQAAVLQDKCPCYNVTLYQDNTGKESYSELLVSRGLGQFAICSQNVSVGVQAKVFVAFTDSPGRFWLHLSHSSSSLDSITSSLQGDSITSSLQPLPQGAIFPGVGCLTKFPEDKQFYRAQVIQMSKGKVDVQFVDYGNNITVSASNIFTLPPDLISIPAQAVQCCLEGARPTQKDWSKESCELFARKTLNIELDAQFVDELTPEVFNVVLHNPEIGSTISEMLISNRCARSSDPPPLISEPPPTMLVPTVPPPLLPTPTPPLNPLWTQYKPIIMDVREKCEITVTFVQSPSVVWGQLSKYQPEFSTMMKKMATLFKNPSSILGLKDPTPGQPCAAQFSDKQWYRGRVDELDASSKRAKVIYVDFGNPEISNISSLKHLPQELLELPTQAVSVSMYGLAPADGGNVWPVETMELFLKLTSSGVLTCEVLELDSDGYPAVRLNDVKGRDIGEELVRAKVARWKEGRRSREPVKSYRQDRPGEVSKRGSASRDGSTRGSGSRDGSTRGSGSRDGSTRGSGSKDGRSGSREGRSGSRDSSTRGSGSRDGSTRGSGSRDSSTRGTRPGSPPKQTQQSPRNSKQKPQSQTNIPSPLRTGTGLTSPPQTDSKRYSTQHLEVGKQYALSVVHIDSLRDFYVQLRDEASKLNQLMDEIAAHCSSDVARLPENVVPGKPVLAQFTDDQEWYRAVITERNQSVSTVTFVDYGNTDRLQDSSLIDIPPELLALPAQAVHCSLTGVGSQVSAEAAKTVFTDLVLEQDTQGVVQSFLMDSSGPVYTIELSLDDGTEVTTALVEGGHISIPQSTLSNLSPTSSPVLTEVKHPSFPVQSHIDVCVSYVKSPGNFFVQLLEKAKSLKELMHGMDELYSSMSQQEEVLFSLDVGVFCVAKFSEDSVWYRARIVSLEGETTRVRFVDYGNEETVAASDLKQLRVQFATEPCCAIHCTLEGLSSDALQSKDICDKFSKIVANDKKLVAKFSAPFSSYSEAIPIQLFDTSQTDMEQDIAVVLSNLHSSMGRSKTTPNSVPHPVKETVDKSDNGAVKGDTRDMTLESGTVRSVVTIPLPQPEMNQPLDCTVTHVNTPSELYCQLQSATPIAEEMLDNLYTFYAEESSGQVLESCEIGTVCAAPFTDGSWYRAKVTALTAEVASVLYFDYGNSTEVPVSDLRVLDEQFRSEPLQALKCLLNGIRPLGTETKWTKECCTKLTETLLEQKCILTVCEVKDDTFHIQLTVSGNDPSRMLIEQGLAEVEAPPTVDTTITCSPLVIPPFPREVGGELNVYVTYSDSPLKIYCQPSELPEEFNRLTEDIQTFCQTESESGVEGVKEGDMVLAQFSSDQSWYRARVLSISDDSKTAKVLFVDYGNSETTAVIRPITEEFCSLPAQAVYCTIMGGEDYDVNPESESDFNDHLTKDESGFCLRFVEICGEKAVVELSRLSDGESVLQHACNLGILLKKSPSPPQMEATGGASPPEPSDGPGEGDVRNKDNFKQGPPPTPMLGFLPAVRKPNTVEDGFISHFETPSSFWVQLAKNESNLEILSERLAAVYGDSKEVEKLVLPDPKPGRLCCAQFSEDKQWYRSIIDVIDSNGVRVYFVDYGNGETMPTDRIKVLKEEFLEVRVHALHCSLIDVVPTTGNIWLDESTACFSGLVLNNTVTVKFINDSSGVWLVRLTSQNEDVAMKMVKEGVAISNKPLDDDTIAGPPSEENSAPLDPNLTSEGIIPNLEFKEGDSLEVYISHLTNTPTEFYCQLADNEASIDELMASIADFYTDNSPPATLEVGSFCVVQYSGNNSWYRAKILGIQEGGEGCEGITVRFVDFGNYETVPPSQVLGLHQNLAALAGQAICCSLTSDMSLEVAPENMARLMELNLEQCYRLSIKGCLGDRYIVDLLDLHGTILNEQFLSLETEDTTQPSAALLPAYKPLPYSVSSVMDVYVSHIDSPMSFYCQPLQLGADLDTMMTELAETVSKSTPAEIETIVPGLPCLAKFSEDGEWYRAKIIKGSDSDEVVAHFVDYGNSEVTTPPSLCKIPDNLLKEPVQSLHCSVFDTSINVKWTEEKIEEFRSMISVEPLSLTITGVDPDSGVCVCTLSSNGAPIDLTPLLQSLLPLEGVLGKENEEVSSRVVATSEVGVASQEMDKQSRASSAASSLPPTTGVPPTTNEGRDLDNSKRPTDDNILPLATNLTISANISTLALKGSSHVSEDLSDTESSEEISDQGDGEGEPLIKAPFLLNLSIQEQFEANVVYVESPSLLFLQRADCQAELNKLSTEIQQYCVSFAEKQQQDIFQKGDFVLSLYSDDSWYRAKVMDAGNEGNIQVYFIDFGNTEWIAPDKLVMCPESYLELPCQAIACSLANVPRRDSWPDEYKSLLDEKVGDRLVKVRVVHPASEGMRPTVIIEDSESGSNVAQNVLDFLQEECERGNVSNYVIPEEPEGEITSENEGEFPTDSLEEATDKSVTESTSKCVVPERKLDTGTSYGVYVISCETPHSFVLHLPSETDALDTVTSSLEAIYENKDTSHLSLPSTPALGECVCAQFSDDSRWYRARVTGVEQENKVEVLFIDFGNSEVSDLTRLRTLDPSLSSHPPFAIECFLAGVEHSSDAEGFTEEASRHLLEVTGKGESACKAEVLFADSAGHYGVNLFSSEGVNVAESLIDAHLATPLQNTPASLNSTSVSDDITPTANQSDPSSGGAPPSVANQQEESPFPTDGVETELEKPVSSVHEKQSDQFATKYPTHSLQVGSTSNAVITSITSLDEFYCQLIDNLGTLDTVMETIALRQYQVGDNLHVVTEPQRDLPVCACFTEDDVWYRAKITAILSPDRVRVSYVDYGNMEDVSLSRVKRLEREIADVLPPVVVKCSLAPLTDHDLDPSRPLDGAWDLMWPNESLGQFREMVGEGEVELVYGGVGEGGEWRVDVMVIDGGAGEGGGEVDSETSEMPSNGPSSITTTKLSVRAALVSRLISVQSATKEQLGHVNCKDGTLQTDKGGGDGDGVTPPSGEESSSQTDEQDFTTPPDSIETEVPNTSSVLDSRSDETGVDSRVDGRSDFDQELDDTAQEVTLRAISKAEESLKDELGSHQENEKGVVGDNGDDTPDSGVGRHED